MDKVQTERILVAILVVVFGSIIAIRFVRARLGRIIPEPLIPAEIKEPLLRPPKEKSLPELPIIEYTGNNERDPLQVPPQLMSRLSQLMAEPGPGKVPTEREMPISEIIALPELSLQGIVWGTGTPKAIINGEVVGKGDTILGVEIIDIQEEGVRLIYEGSEFTITFQGRGQK